MAANPPQANAHSGHWSGTGRMRGGRLGPWFFITALRLLGLRLTRCLVLPFAAGFALISPDVQATMDYHRRVFGPVPRWKRRWLVAKHFNSFGRMLVDRVAILAGNVRHFSFSFDGEHHLREAVAQKRGVLLLTAHLGNWEAAGQLLSRLDVPVNVTGFDNESAGIRALLNQSSKATFRFLPLGGAPTDAIPLLAALRRGEVVAMMGDRAYDGPSANIPFLDGLAAFPLGPYILAGLAGAPLVPVFNVSEPGNHYRFIGFPPQQIEMPPRPHRDAHLRHCAQLFARDLETVLRRNPMQWHNFYPFWMDETLEFGNASVPPTAQLDQRPSEPPRGAPVPSDATPAPH
jgi:predicted LPLAT superfamily acyltransferase